MGILGVTWVVLGGTVCDMGVLGDDMGVLRGDMEGTGGDVGLLVVTGVDMVGTRGYWGLHGVVGG